MKELLLSVIIIGISVMFISCDHHLAQSQMTDAGDLNVLYPTATKFSTILYAAGVKEKEGDINRMADHLTLKGDGKLMWEKVMAEQGEYEVVLNYATHQEGASVKLTTGKGTTSDQVDVTEGIYLSNGEWYNNNFERKLMPERLNLTEGLNLISLQIKAPNRNFETAIFSVEFIPVVKKSAVIKDIMKAITSRPTMDWFSEMNYGVMFHWTSQSAPRIGDPKSYQEAVKDFDVDAFVDMVEKTGAEYVIFTGNHAEPHFPAPLKKWAEVYPGRTTERDLISEISEALEEKNIRFILYLATHIYAQQDQVDTKEFEKLNFELVSEIGERYKEKIDGYWFDGFYQSYQSHPDFNFEKFYKISKAGNPERLLALNTWLYPIVTEWQDYWAGEIYSLGVPPNDRIIQSGPGKGLPYHALVVLENDWVHTNLNTAIPSPRLDTKDLVDFISSAKGKGPVTINLGIYQDGSIGEEAIAVMERIKQNFQNSQQEDTSN